MISGFNFHAITRVNVSGSKITFLVCIFSPKKCFDREIFKWIWHHLLMDYLHDALATEEKQLSLLISINILINTDRLIYAAAEVLGKKNYILSISKAHLYSSSLHIPTEHLSNRLVRKKYIFNGFCFWTKYYSPNQPAASLNTQVYWVMNNHVINLFMTAVLHKIFKLYLFIFLACTDF